MMDKSNIEMKRKGSFAAKIQFQKDGLLFKLERIFFLLQAYFLPRHQFVFSKLLGDEENLL